MSRRFSLAIICGTALSLSLLSWHEADGEGGGESRPVREYKSHGEIRFDIELDYVAFGINTWQGKYRVIRARINNTTKMPLVLSSQRDVVQAVLSDGKKVAAQLVPSKSAPELWDKLEPHTRKLLTYPRAVGANEIEHVYLFFPADRLMEMPSSFSWNIDSTKTTYATFDPPAAAP